MTSSKRLIHYNGRMYLPGLNVCIHWLLKRNLNSQTHHCPNQCSICLRSIIILVDCAMDVTLTNKTYNKLQWPIFCLSNCHCTKQTYAHCWSSVQRHQLTDHACGLSVHRIVNADRAAVGSHHVSKCHITVHFTTLSAMPRRQTTRIKRIPAGNTLNATARKPLSPN